MAGIQTGLTDAELLASQLKAHELVGLKASVSEINGSVSRNQIVLPKNLISNGDNISIFDSLDGWSISSGDEAKITLENSVNPFSSNSLKILETEPGGSLSISKNVNINILGVENISVFIKNIKAGTYGVGNIQLELYSSTTLTTNKYTIQLKPLLDSYINSTWENIQFKISDLIPSGVISPKDLIKKIKFTFFGLSGERININLAGMSIDAKSRPAISFSFDDCNETDYTVAYPSLKRYGFSGISYIISEDIGHKEYPSGPRLDLVQMQEMYENGWTFGNHGKDYLNLVTESSIAEAEISIKTCRDFLYDNGFVGEGLKHLAYPHGEFNEEVKAVLSKYNIKYARSVKQSLQYSPVESLQEIKCFALKPTLQENIDLIDNYMQNHSGLLNLYGHELYDNQSVKITATIFSQVVDYINTNYRRYVTTIPQWCKDYETGAYI